MKDVVLSAGLHPAKARFESMKLNVNLEPVIAFAVRDGYLPNDATARIAFDGLLQWLAAHAVEEHADQPFVMMNGCVDQAFHAFLLNTRAYLHFCREHIGFFIHHTPIDDRLADELAVMGGIDYTINYMQVAFGDELAPTIAEWVLAHKIGTLTISSVSCVGNGTDRDAHEIIGGGDFRTFWDTNPDLSAAGIA